MARRGKSSKGRRRNGGDPPAGGGGGTAAAGRVPGTNGRRIPQSYRGGSHPNRLRQGGGKGGDRSAEAAGTAHGTKHRRGDEPAASRRDPGLLNPSSRNAKKESASGPKKVTNKIANNVSSSVAKSAKLVKMSRKRIARRRRRQSQRGASSHSVAPPVTRFSRIDGPPRLKSRSQGPFPLPREVTRITPGSVVQPADANETLLADDRHGRRVRDHRDGLPRRSRDSLRVAVPSHWAGKPRSSLAQRRHVSGTPRRSTDGDSDDDEGESTDSSASLSSSSDATFTSSTSSSASGSSTTSDDDSDDDGSLQDDSDEEESEESEHGSQPSDAEAAAAEQAAAALDAEELDVLLAPPPAPCGRRVGTGVPTLPVGLPPFDDRVTDDDSDETAKKAAILPSGIATVMTRTSARRGPVRGGAKKGSAERPLCHSTRLVETCDALGTPYLPSKQEAADGDRPDNIEHGPSVAANGVLHDGRDVKGVDEDWSSSSTSSGDANGADANEERCRWVTAALADAPRQLTRCHHVVAVPQVHESWGLVASCVPILRVGPCDRSALEEVENSLWPRGGRDDPRCAKSSDRAVDEAAVRHVLARREKTETKEKEESEEEPPQSNAAVLQGMALRQFKSSGAAKRYRDEVVARCVTPTPSLLGEVGNRWLLPTSPREADVMRRRMSAVVVAAATTPLRSALSLVEEERPPMGGGGVASPSSCIVLWKDGDIGITQDIIGLADEVQMADGYRLVLAPIPTPQDLVGPRSHSIGDAAEAAVPHAAPRGRGFLGAERPEDDDAVAVRSRRDAAFMVAAGGSAVFTASWRDIVRVSQPPAGGGSFSSPLLSTAAAALPLVAEEQLRRLQRHRADRRDDVRGTPSRIVLCEWLCDALPQAGGGMTATGAPLPPWEALGGDPAHPTADALNACTHHLRFLLVRDGPNNGRFVTVAELLPFLESIATAMQHAEADAASAEAALEEEVAAGTYSDTALACRVASLGVDGRVLNAVPTSLPPLVVSAGAIGDAAFVQRPPEAPTPSPPLLTEEGTASSQFRRPSQDPECKRIRLQRALRDLAWYESQLTILQQDIEASVVACLADIVERRLDICIATIRFRQSSAGFSSGQAPWQMQCDWAWYQQSPDPYRVLAACVELGLVGTEALQESVLARSVASDAEPRPSSRVLVGGVERGNGDNDDDAAVALPPYRLMESHLVSPSVFEKYVPNAHRQPRDNGDEHDYDGFAGGSWPRSHPSSAPPAADSIMETSDSPPIGGHGSPTSSSASTAVPSSSPWLTSPTGSVSASLQALLTVRQLFQRTGRTMTYAEFSHDFLRLRR